MLPYKCAHYVNFDGGRRARGRLRQEVPGGRPESWSPDGERLLFRAIKGADISLWMLSVREKTAEPFGGVQSLDPTNAVFSPDGKWVAYSARERGRTNSEVFVQPFPATGAKYQLPVPAGNHFPVWLSGGRELSYIVGPSGYAVVNVPTAPAFVFGAPSSVPLETMRNLGPNLPRHFDVTPDGRFVSVIPAGESSSGSPSRTSEIQVVLNWFSELEQRVPVK